jgi:hypothetical protein
MISFVTSHRRLSHADSRHIRKMFKIKLIEGINLRSFVSLHTVLKVKVTMYKSSTLKETDRRNIQE